MIKSNKKKRINNYFPRNNEGPSQHALVTIRGRCESEGSGEADQEEQGLGDKGVKVQ